MDNKKGFTLIEIMAAIVILGLITVLIIPIYNNVTGKTQEKAYKSKVKLIETRAGNYAEGIKNELKISPDPICVTIETLIKQNFLLSDDAKALLLTNPNPEKSETGKYMAGIVILEYINGKISVDYSLDNSSCGTIIAIPDYDDRYVIDLDPPTGTVRINPPSDFTNSLDLSLTLEPDDDAYEFCFNSVNTSCIVFKKLSAYNLNNVAYRLPIDANQGTNTVYVWYRDKHLNTMASPAEASILYDTILPTCPVIDGTNWVASRTVSWGCADEVGGSGCDPISEGGSKLFSKDTVTTPQTIVTWHLNAYTIYDRAGNKRICSDRELGVYVDLTPPTCAVSGSNDTWTNGNREIKAECNDGDSGCAVLSLAYNYGANPSETAINTSAAGAVGISSGGRFYDRVGNWVDCAANQTVKIDKIKPTCSIVADVTSWTNGDVKTTLTGSDTGGSNVSSVNPGTGSVSGSTATRTHGSNATQNGSVADVAGNTGTCSYVVSNIDKTDPTCAVSGGSSTWTGSSRTVTATCSDSGSGCATVPFSKTYNYELDTTSAGAIGISSGGSVTDKAGNSANCSANQTVKIDTTSPTCSWTRGDWGNPTTPTVSGSDSGGSGVAYVSSGGSWVGGSSTTGSFSSGGTKTGKVQDGAGNEGTCNIDIDSWAGYWQRTCKTMGTGACNGYGSYSKDIKNVCKTCCSETGSQGTSEVYVKCADITMYNWVVGGGPDDGWKGPGYYWTSSKGAIDDCKLKGPWGGGACASSNQAMKQQDTYTGTCNSWEPSNCTDWNDWTDGHTSCSATAELDCWGPDPYYLYY